MITDAHFTALPWLKHGFFTREGGVSTGFYASLNCGPGSGDDPAAVSENRTRAMSRLDLPAQTLQSLYQVHGRDVVTLDAPLPDGERPKADGLATAAPGVALGILTADCAPVLLADPVARVIGACHAGWRGALIGITDATLDAMIALGARADRVRACIGPTIAFSSYEVGTEFPAPFLQQDRDNARFFGPADRAGHFRFDLPGYLLSRLAARSVAASNTDIDTLTAPDRLFSFRRTTHRRETDYGRQLSVIAIAP